MIQIPGHDFRDLVAHMKMCLKPPLGYSLHLHTITEYERMTCLIDGDRPRYMGGGFAISETGELVNAFSIQRKQGPRLVREAVERGATWLEVYDGPIADLYRTYCFDEVSREPFNPLLADPRWNVEKYGTPDVLRMEHKFYFTAPLTA